LATGGESPAKTIPNQYPPVQAALPHASASAAALPGQQVAPSHDGFAPLPQPAVPPPAGPAAAPRRQPQRAKFIAGDATTTQIEVGADGQLPQLKLVETGETELKRETPRFSNPLLLVLALVASTSLSVGMLFWDTSADRPEAAVKAEARQSLIDDYIHAPPKLEPYKMLLRRALQAHSSGEYQTERRLYRQVLDMLHAEDKNREGNRRGLTGLREERDNRPPNDQHLKEQLTILLRDD
jgi:hypothetical protein